MQRKGNYRTRSMLLDTVVDRNKTWQPPASVTPTAYPIRHARYLSAIALHNQLNSRSTHIQSQIEFFLTERYQNTKIYCNIIGIELFLGRWDESLLGPHRAPMCYSTKVQLGKATNLLGLPQEHSLRGYLQEHRWPQSSWLNEVSCQTGDNFPIAV